MSSALLLVLLLLGGSASATRWERTDAAQWTEERRVEPFCYAYNYTCGPIAPSPSKSYEAHMEHVDLVHQSTHYIEEFYDYETNLLAVTDAWGKYFLHTIFYYDLNVAVFILTETEMELDHHPTTCKVAEISQDTFFNPVPGDNTTVHQVLAPSQAMLFGNNYRYSYVDNGTVRAMEYNRWDACISTERDSFYVEYYWSDPQLVMDMDGFTSERPLKMRMTGHAQPPQGTGELLQIDSVYNMALFDDNPDLSNIRWAFEIPSGVYCEGFPSVKAPPKKLPNFYSMRVEVTLEVPGETHRREEYVSTVKNWYDFYNKLTRADSMTNPATVEFAVAGLVEVATIRDFRAGVEYIIDKTLGNCTTIALTGGGYDTITSPDGHYVMKDPLALFGLTDDANLTYHGMKYARGLPCDVWVGHLEFDTNNGTLHNNYLYELYFLQPGWSEDAGKQTDQLPVPVLIKVHQDFSVDQMPDVYVNLQQNIFKFEEKEPSMSVFDITPCFFGHEHIRRFQMAFPSTFRDDFDNNPALFTQEVLGGVIVYMEIPMIRLQHPQIEYVESYNRLFFEFTLVDQPQVDMDFPFYVGKPLDQVVDTLKQAMDNLVIVIVTDQETLKIMKPIPDSLQEQFDDGCYSRNGHYPSLPDLDDQQSVSHTRHTPSHDHPGKETALGEGGDEAKDPVFPFLTKTHQRVRSNDEKIYSPGAMAGMAMGMLILGLLLGTVVTLVILSKMGLSGDLEYIPMNSRRH